MAGTDRWDRPDKCHDFVQSAKISAPHACVSPVAWVAQGGEAK
jgi:hypothetical protein